MAVVLLVAAAPVRAQAPVRDFPPIEPAALGYSKEAIEGLATTLTAWVEEGRIAGGELLVIADGRTLLHTAAGYRDIERGRPMERGTRFRIQSMTKTVVGTGILMLHDDGELDLDAPAARYVPVLDTDALRGMTVRHLITHTAGFSYSEYNGEVWRREHATRMDAIRALVARGPMYEPGERFSYENGNSDTLAEVLARATGLTATQFLQERVFDPLGMRDTCILAPPPDERDDRYASVYRRGDDGFEKIWDAGSTTDEAFFRGAGGIYSTVVDYARFLAMWMDEGRCGRRWLLRPETARSAVTSTDSSRAANEPYGQNWQIFSEPPDGRLAFGHGGSDGTIGVAVPERRLILCYFTQTRQTDTTREMLALCAQALADE